MKYWVFSGPKLRAERELRHWKPDAFIRLYNTLAPPELQITKQSLFQWENDLHNPSLNHLPIMTTVFGLKTPLDLYEERVVS